MSSVVEVLTESYNGGVIHYDPERQPILRVFRPSSTIYKPSAEETAARKDTLETRVNKWRDHYESGDGFMQASAEAWVIASRSGFSMEGFKEASSHVGWPIRRVLWSFKRRGWKLPKNLQEWAERHVTRYEKQRAQKQAK